MTMSEDEDEEGLDEGGVRDAAQEELQIRRRRHHFLQSQLTNKQTAAFTVRSDWPITAVQIQTHTHSPYEAQEP